MSIRFIDLRYSSSWYLFTDFFVCLDDLFIVKSEILKSPLLLPLCLFLLSDMFYLLATFRCSDIWCIYNYVFMMIQPLCPYIMAFFVSLLFLNFLSLSTSLSHLCKETLQTSSRRQSHKIDLESRSHYSEKRPNNTENSFWTLWYLEINVNFFPNCLL